MVTNFRTGFIAFLCITFSIQADQRHELFMQGNKAYQAGDIAHALQYYKKIIHKGPGVWANIGNCYFAQKELSQAIIAWRKAQAAAPHDLWLSLEKDCAMALKEMGVSHKSDRSHFFDWWAHIVPSLLLQIIFLVCWYFLFFFLLARRPRRYFLYYQIATILSLMLFGTMLLFHYYHDTYEKGIVTKESALKSGPHEQFDTISAIAPFEDVCIHETRQGWYKIATQNHIGWLASDLVEKL